MRRIGIMTFHNAENYGAVLQAYALKQCLEKENPSDAVSIVDYRNPLIEQSYAYFKPYSFFRNKGAARLLSVLLQLYYFPERVGIKRRFRAFCDEYLEPADKPLHSYDWMVYGSDQIWNPTLTGGDGTYMGKGFSGRKISYGASDGGELQVDKDIIQSLEGFDAISCRETSLARRLEPYISPKPLATVCDPVFLLSKEEWLAFAKSPKETDYVLIYKVAENPVLDTEAERFAKSLGKRVVQIVYVRSVRTMLCFTRKFVSAISPNEFVGYFAWADFVLTTSFHGTAFSIILEKDFYTFQFDHRAQRITDLLEELDLAARFVKAVPGVKSRGDHGVHYESVAPRLAAYRQKSVDFLRRSLGDA